MFTKPFAKLQCLSSVQEDGFTSDRSGTNTSKTKGSKFILNFSHTDDVLKVKSK